MKDFIPNLKFQFNQETFLNYSENGDGQTSMIFLAGFGQATYSWDSFNEKLSTDTALYTIYNIDLLGFGFSTKRKANIYSIEKQAEVLSSFLNFKKITSFVLVGHSYGGLVCLSLLDYLRKKKSNIKCKSLVLFDTPAFLGSEPSFVKALRNPILKFIGSIFYSPSITAKQTIYSTFYDSKAGINSFYELYYFFYSLPQCYNAMSMVANQTSESALTNLEKSYKHIEIPTLLIWGKQDKMIPLKYGEKLHSEIRNSVLKVIEECGHIPLQEKPTDSAEIFSQFIKATIS